MKYSVGIVTYVKRYENYFQPLIKQIKCLKPEAEIIVCVNGEYNKPFDSNYRSEILRFISNYENIFPTFHPEFRSLSKLWNTCLINSTRDHVLLLNDDLSVTSPSFFNNLDRAIVENDKKSFKINGSWSHAFLNRREVGEVGWFDERYLGVGEEDGDFEWRWNRKFKKPFENRYIDGITNHVEHKECLEGIQIINNKYSKFNHDFAFNTKYKVCDRGENFGIMERNLVCLSETLPQHLAERFYWENKHKL
jgi:hypothetical protein